MSYKVTLIPGAVGDYKKLDGSIRKEVNKRIDELKENPLMGKRLGKKFNIDLRHLQKSDEFCKCNLNVDTEIYKYLHSKDL